MKLRLISAASVLWALAGTAAGQAITVTTLHDQTDFPAPQTVAQLPGPDGRVSFREATIAANNTPGPQTIGFAIPQSEWWLITNIALLELEEGPFFLNDDQTTVDFTTQTAFTGNTNPNGNEVGIYGLEPNGAGSGAIFVNGDHCVIKGLDRVMQRGHAVQIGGNHNRVIGCTISGPLFSAVYISGGFSGPAATLNVVGGTEPSDGNVLSAGNHGVRIDTPAQDNVVIGNTLSGTFAGVAVRGNPFTGSPVGNRIGGPTAAERNVIAGAGRFGEEGFPDGAQVSLVMATGTLIEGNFIGTTPDGSAPAPSQRGPIGVEVRDSTGTTIRGNLISGIRIMGVNHYAGQLFGDGVRVTAINGPTSDTLIQNNRIGTDAAGQSPVPNLYGVRVVPLIASQPITQTRVERNVVAFNERAGVAVSSLVSGVRITETTFHDSGQLAIDLLSPAGGSGVTPNDPGDADTGGNDLQNFPVIDAAQAGPSGTTVSGTLNSLPGQQFTLEFFGSPACDPSGFGEGALFLGSLNVTTDGSGNAAFAGTVPGAVQPGASVTATATQVSTGNTSEFSACVAATGGGLCYANCDGSTGASPLNVNDFVCFQNRFAAADPYADCDQSGSLNVNDFICFQGRFAAGCR